MYPFLQELFFPIGFSDGVSNETCIRGNRPKWSVVKQPDSEYRRKGGQEVLSYSGCLWALTKSVGLVRSIYMREDFIVNDQYSENKE
jgi:hypothetical protein